MINALIDGSLKNRLWVILGTVAVALLGVAMMLRLPIDAVPDITPVQVLVNTKTQALDPQQVEKTITYYVETEMSGLPNVQEVRSLSRFGLSQVVVVFEDGTDIYRARQVVLEKLQGLSEKLPPGAAPELGPISTGLGEVLMYVVEAKASSPLAKQPVKDRLTYLRTIQDFVIRPHLKAHVKNIGDIDTIGGFQKQIHIDLNPERMEAYGVTLTQVMQNLTGIGENVGGGYVELGKDQLIVRGFGQVSLGALEQIPAKVNVFGAPIRLHQIAAVRADHSQRIGAATSQGSEAVLGTVLMLLGANSRAVARDAQDALATVKLPPDVVTRIVYTRSFLVDATLRTVSLNLLEGALLVVLVLFLVLGNFRAALVVAVVIPLSMLGAAIGMERFGVSANLMSLGAIDFGLLVDASVVMVENLVRKLEQRKASHLTLPEKLKLVGESCREVSKPVTMGLLIIMVVYIPILGLEGVEGKMYRPMAITVLMALGASLLLALTVIPVLALIFVRVSGRHEPNKGAFAWIARRYESILRFSLRRPLYLIIPAVLFVIFSGWLFSRIGSDFMPPLDEGDLVVNIVMPASIGITASVEGVAQSERIISEFAEVKSVFSRLGTAESATDPMGANFIDVFVILEKATDSWPKQPGGRVRTKDELVRAIKERIEKKLPDAEVTDSQPIAMRFNEILEGSRADVSLRIYGSDLDELTRLQDEAVRILSAVPGAAEVELDALTALRKSPVLDAKLQFGRMAAYGIPIKDVNDVIEILMGGRTIGSYYEQDWRFPVVVRMREDFRADLGAIARMPVPLADGGTVPFSYLVDLKRADRVTAIARSGNRRYAGVAVQLSGRDTLSFVTEAKERIAERLRVPEGYHLQWGGQFKNLERARARLLIIVPGVLALIFLLLYRVFESVGKTLLIYTAIPFAVTGGIVALALRGMNFSVSAAIGFIALSGIAILNGLVIVSFFRQLQEEGLAVNEAVIRGALVRLRPVLMTSLVAGLGFIPMALNSGIGAQVQRPLATVVIGGLFTSTLLTLVLVPALYAWLERKTHGGTTS